MARRVVGTPPALPGYTYVRPLGSGGCADVFCYEQHLPRRAVAVKVLLAGSDDDVREMLLAEATLMAQLSSHPAILTVHDAGLTADGRPYLVTELCPGGYGGRYRREQLALPEVLEVAVAIGSALETAHRAQVLHRDVKPSNVLVTGYGRPVLADFGVAATLARAERGEVTGMSVPWSAPEVLRGTTSGTVRSDLWGFAATVYALLAGRSPFERSGALDGVDAVEARILGRGAVAPTGRTDVPPALEDLLAAALSKDPARRPESVLDLLLDLQLVQAEAGLRPTSLDVPQDPVLLSSPAPVTRLDGPTGSGRPRADESVGRRARTPAPRRGGTGTGATSGTRGSDHDGTVLRAWDDAVRTGPARPGTGRTGTRRPGTWRRTTGRGVGKPGTGVGTRARVVLAAVVAALVVVAGLAVLTLLRDPAIPAVEGVEAVAEDGSVRFTWPDPGLRDGESYVVRVDDGPGVVQHSRTLSVRTDDGGRVCATVAVVRDGTTGPESDAACARDEDGTGDAG